LVVAVFVDIAMVILVDHVLFPVYERQDYFAQQSEKLVTETQKRSVFNVVFTFCLDAGVVLVFFVRPFSVQKKGCRDLRVLN
jgi:hypothetical protein